VKKDAYSPEEDHIQYTEHCREIENCRVQNQLMPTQNHDRVSGALFNQPVMLAVYKMNVPTHPNF
jgi:hypothetical protein